VEEALRAGAAELRALEGKVQRLHRSCVESVLREQVRDAGAGEEAQVRLVQQPGRTVPEFAGEQPGDHACVRYVRNREKGAPVRREQLRELIEDAPGVAQVLEHICTHDCVVRAAWEMLGEPDIFEVELQQLAVVWARQCRSLRIELDAVDDAALVVA